MEKRLDNMEEKTTPHLEKLNIEQSIQNGSEPANPVKKNSDFRHGLTKRETMAMHLCSAYISCGHTVASATSNAVNCADSLLEELRKNKS